MSGPEETGPVDEFDWIDQCLRPLAAAAPEALDLLDDAALISARPGFELVVSADAIVEGVHFRASDPLDLVARKLLRVNLSDLAAKAAEPYAYLMTLCWPAASGWPERRRFAQGLAEDQARFGVRLLGGDTTATPGPFTASLTVFGWAPSGAMVRRSAARVGDVVLVSGTIGDGWLGLRAGEEPLGLGPDDAEWLLDRYRLPQPRLSLATALRSYANAAADVSDGLLADAGRIGRASGLRLVLDLDRIPLSAPARAWLAGQGDSVAARMALAAGGDDYEVVCTAPPENASRLAAAAAAAGVELSAVGEVTKGEGVRAIAKGVERPIARAGYRHG
jgi:thiamine-monophosphate kinase